MVLVIISGLIIYYILKITGLINWINKQIDNLKKRDRFILGMATFVISGILLKITSFEYLLNIRSFLIIVAAAFFYVIGGNCITAKN
ncbi:hypothetical protein SDC9_201557 [bioreactor metagenome]|uniref:Uncharacterized protein n=2 Tax=root TaxID=1 RepID=A0A645IU08_9ZZZZ